MKPEVPPSEAGDQETGALDATTWVELDVPESPPERDQALRLLARLLVSAARKDASGGADQPAADPRIPVDVAGGPEVGLDRG